MLFYASLTHFCIFNIDIFVICFLGIIMLLVGEFSNAACGGLFLDKFEAYMDGVSANIGVFFFFFPVF